MIGWVRVALRHRRQAPAPWSGRAQAQGWPIPMNPGLGTKSPWGFPVGLLRSRPRGPGRDRRPRRTWRRPAPAAAAPPRTSGRRGRPALPGDGGAAEGDGRVARWWSFLAAAGQRGAGRGGRGRSPGAGRVGPADMVVCDHVLYNVADLARSPSPDGHAAAVVVAERPITPARRPGPAVAALPRPRAPDRPRAGDAVATLAAAGLEVESPGPGASGRALVRRLRRAAAFSRRRLAPAAGRDPEVAEVLLQRGTDPRSTGPGRAVSCAGGRSPPCPGRVGTLTERREQS